MKHSKNRRSTAFLTTDLLVHFSSRRSAEGNHEFFQVNDLVACFWLFFGSHPEVLELARSLNSYFLECYIWSCGFHQDVFMGRWRLNFFLVFLKSFVWVRLVFFSFPALEYYLDELLSLYGNTFGRRKVLGDTSLC